MTHTTISVKIETHNKLKELCSQLSLKEGKNVSFNSLLERVANSEFNVSGAFIRLSDELDKSIKKIDDAVNSIRKQVDEISAAEFEEE